MNCWEEKEKATNSLWSHRKQKESGFLFLSPRGSDGNVPCFGKMRFSSISYYLRVPPFCYYSKKTKTQKNKKKNSFFPLWFLIFSFCGFRILLPFFCASFASCVVYRQCWFTGILGDFSIMWLAVYILLYIFIFYILYFIFYTDWHYKYKGVKRKGCINRYIIDICFLNQFNDVLSQRRTVNEGNTQVEEVLRGLKERERYHNYHQSHKYKRIKSSND